MRWLYITDFGRQSSLGSDQPEKRLGCCRQILMDEFRAVLIEDTDVHRFRM